MKFLNTWLRPKIADTTKVIVVSFPRSGHHALIGFLSKISDFANNYCEFYTCTRHNGESIDCQFNGIDWRERSIGCGALCSNLKNHDFNLNLPYKKNCKYIIQYRHPLLSIKSWYDMETSKGEELPEWSDFLSEKLLFWQKFIDKWVCKYGHKENVMLVPYDSLASTDKVVEIAKFCDADMNIDANQNNHGFVKKAHDIEVQDSYMEMENTIRPWLTKANIPALFSGD